MNTVIYMGHAMPMKVSADYYLSYRTNTRSFVGFSSNIPRSMIIDNAAYHRWAQIR